MRVQIAICPLCKPYIPDDNRITYAHCQPLICQTACPTCGRSTSNLWYCTCKVKNPRPKRSNAQRRLELLAEIRDRAPLVVPTS